MILDAELCLVRPFRDGDLAALLRQADNAAIARNLRDRFPHPYTLAAAKTWLAFVAAQEPLTNFAIEVDGELAGGIGYSPRTDVERFSAEIGYWIGEPYWGCGIATAAVREFAPWIFATTNLQRLDALVFANNAASRRVLDKAGFTCEARLRNAIFKNEAFADAWLYSRLRGDPDPRVLGS